MTFTRRRLCLAGVSFAILGGSGCLGGSSDTDGSTATAEQSNDTPDTSDDDDPSDAAPETDEGRNDGWEWSGGTLSVESAVQHCDPSHECCADYAEYLEYHDVEVAVEEMSESELETVKDEFGVPEDARSCHTVEIGGYLVEGHVPLDAIDTLLTEEPDVIGIAVPGQPRYSPGLGPNSDRPMPVYSFDDEGTVTVFERV